MAHWAKPGMKCVCIKQDAWRQAEDGRSCVEAFHPTFRGVYTVARLEVRRSGELGLLLGEFPDRHYRPKWFRPLIIRTQSEDVELFAPLLDPANHRELERV